MYAGYNGYLWVRNVVYSCNVDIVTLCDKGVQHANVCP